MKRIFYSLLLGCSLLGAGCVTGNVADFTIRVTDDDGKPVAKATVGVGYVIRSTTIEVGGPTDTNGVFHYRGTFGVDNGWFVRKESFYDLSHMEMHFTNVVFGRLQPWGERHEVTLRRIINPIGMYATTMSDPRSVRIPELGKPFGFDLMKSDWVAPFGKGEVADFIFQLESVGDAMRRNASLTLTFSNPDDGLQVFFSDPRGGGSVFRSPRYAPKEGYATNFVSVYRSMGGERRDDEREDQNYTFRVRTKRDEHGAITNAFYGKIYGPIKYGAPFVGCTYYLNPTSLDRNLEFDRTKNLLKGVVEKGQMPFAP